MMFTEKNKIKKSDLTFTNKCFIGIICSSVVIAIFYCFANGISGNDYWWHIKLGEWVWKNKSVPTTDVFSWYGIENSLKITVQQWLADVWFYGLQKTFGSIGVFLFSLFSALGLIFLIIKSNVRKLLINAPFSALFLVLFAVLSTLFFYGRPQIFSFYFFYIILYCLFSFINNPKSKAIYFVPLIGCLWSNFHGGSSNLSYLLCLAFLIIGFIKLDINKLYSERLSKQQLRTLALITGVTVLSVLINPIGFNVLIYPYVNMGDSFMLAVVSEWSSPDAKNIGDLILYFVPLLLVFFSFIISKKRIKLLNLFLLLFFSFMFMRSIRFIIFFYIAVSFFAFDYMPRWSVKEIKGKFEKTIVMLFFVVICAGVIHSIANVVPLVAEDKLISKAMSDDLVAVVRNENPKRIFNDYNFGETLIYNDIPVFFDSRADLYAADNIMKNGVSLMYLQSQEENKPFDVETMINNYKFDGIVVSVSRPLYAYLLSHEDKYQLVYSDDIGGYFKVL